jgi:hypothetical protein
MKQKDNDKLYFPPVTIFTLIEAMVLAQTVVPSAENTPELKQSAPKRYNRSEENHDN